VVGQTMALQRATGLSLDKISKSKTRKTTEETISNKREVTEVASAIVNTKMVLVSQWEEAEASMTDKNLTSKDQPEEAEELEELEEASTEMLTMKEVALTETETMREAASDLEEDLVKEEVASEKEEEALVKAEEAAEEALVVASTRIDLNQEAKSQETVDSILAEAEVHVLMLVSLTRIRLSSARSKMRRQRPSLMTET